MNQPHESNQKFTGKVDLSIEISAPVSRVWQALTLPSEVAVWDTGIVRALNARPDYPQPGQQVQWQYRLGPIPLTLHDHPQKVVKNQLLRTQIKLGFLRYLETYTLTHDQDSGITMLNAELFVGNSLPLIAGMFDRLIGIPMSRSTVQISLKAIKVFCEKEAS